MWKSLTLTLTLTHQYYAITAASRPGQRQMMPGAAPRVGPPRPTGCAGRGSSAKRALFPSQARPRATLRRRSR
eukprot:scaffold971_cov32-Phaeocystis_antarctica.AAC.3